MAIDDASGQRVRLIDAPATAGLHRAHWDLRGSSPDPIELDPPTFRPPWADGVKGPLVAPGRCTATLLVLTPGGARQIGAPQAFEVTPVPNLPAGLDLTAVATFQAQVAAVQRRVAAARALVRQAREELRYMEAALVATPGADASLAGRLDAARRALADIARRRTRF